MWIQRRITARTAKVERMYLALVVAVATAHLSACLLCGTRRTVLPGSDNPPVQNSKFECPCMMRIDFHNGPSQAIGLEKLQS